MDTQNWPKNEWEDIYHGLQEISRKMENIMFNCVDDIDAKRFAQDCYDDIETWMDNCKQKGNFTVETLDLTSSKKPIKSDRHFKYDEYLGNIYDSDPSNADFWSRDEYNEMVEKARDIFYPAVQKAANACRFTVSDNEAEYVAEKCVRQFFDNTSWDEAVNRPEEYYVNSSKKPIKSDYKGLDDEVGDLQIDMTNTGYFEDGWLRIEGENEEGYRDGTEFTINAYGPNGEDLGSKKFDFLDLWHKGPIASSKEPVQSAMPGREKGIRAIMDEYGCSWEEAEEIMNEQVSSSRKSLKSAMPGKEKYIQAVMDEYGCSREEAEEIIADEISSGCHDKSKKEKKEEKKPEKIEQTRRARNTESLNNLYGKMFS